MSDSENKRISEPKGENQSLENISYEKGYVRLPFDEEQFKEFITGLLGKPQTINSTVWGPFKIGFEEIKDLHLAIQQRISQQNKGTLIRFNSTITFEDESSVTLNSFDALMSYREIKNVICTAIDLSWLYLVQFPERDVPERQEIDISFITDKVKTFRKAEFGNMPLHTPSNYINIQIKHTARTWGTDLETLLKSLVSNYKTKRYRNSIEEFIHKNEILSGILVGVLFFAGSVAGVILSNAKFKANYLADIEKSLESISSPSEIGQFKEQTDFFITFLAEGKMYSHYHTNVVYLIISVVVSILVMVLVGAMAERFYLKRSYILITRKSSTDFEKDLVKDRKDWRNFIGSIVVSIVVGLIANYIFFILTTN